MAGNPFEGLFELFVCCRDNAHAKGRGFDASIYQQAFDASDICGIGIVFRPDRTGALRVITIVPGGPAAKAGLVKEEDVLYEVDSDNVYRLPASKVASKLMGPRGSVVRIAFLRQDRIVDVALVRDMADDLKSQVTDEDMERASTPSSLNSLPRPVNVSINPLDSESPAVTQRRRRSSSGLVRMGDLPEGERMPAFTPVHIETINASARVNAALERVKNKTDGGGSRNSLTDPAELERIRQKLERQEKWAVKVGATLSPRQSPGETVSKLRVRPKDSEGTPEGMKGESPENFKSRDKEDLVDKQSLESIKKKLDSQDKWIKKIFAQDNQKRKPNNGRESGEGAGEAPLVAAQALEAEI